MSGTGLVTVDIPYRDGFFTLKLPDDAELVEPNALDGAVPGLGGPAVLKGTGNSARDLVTAQVAKPIDAAPFDEFLQGATDLLVIVNDGTRPTPTSVVLDCIGDALESHNAHFWWLRARIGRQPKKNTGEFSETTIFDFAARLKRTTQKMQARL